MENIQDVITRSSDRTQSILTKRTKKIKTVASTLKNGYRYPLQQSSLQSLTNAYQKDGNQTL